MQWKLKVIQGKNAGQEIEILGNKFLIGRAEDCNLRPSSDMISRHHCAIVIDGDYSAVRDFGSKNGTLLNDQRVLGEAEIKAGDHLRVGPLEFEVITVQGSLGGKKRPPVHDAKEAAARTAESISDEDQDVSRWLADQPPSNSPTSDTQSLRLSDTDVIDIGTTRAIVPPAPAPPVVAAQPAAVAPTPVAAPAVAQPIKPAVAKTPTPAAYVPPVYEPPAEPAAADPPSSNKPAKKGFGKLPPNLHGSKDSREAANDILNKMRKRR